MPQAKEDMSTADYACNIAESITNGQRGQSVHQFESALQDHCAAYALAFDIREAGTTQEEIIRLLCSVIDNRK